MKTLIISALFMASFASQAGGLADELTTLAPELKKEVAVRATEAMECASNGQKPQLLIVADMSLPSNKKRLWAFELDKTPELVVRDFVAHGRGSDPQGRGITSRFSNTPDSGMTSLGLYRVAEQYKGKHGLSRRLDGLMKGLNDQARARAVVLHPSDYVRPGHVGRSLGCPAVREKVLVELERAGLGDAMLWIDGGDTKVIEKALAKCTVKKRIRKSLPKPTVLAHNTKDGLIWPPFGRLCLACPWANNIFS